MVDKPIFELGGDPGIPTNPNKPTLGIYLCIGPEKPPEEEEVDNRYVNLDFTGKPGTASSLYFSLVFQLPKWDWHLEKADEWIEVSPTHREYYERTMSTKQMLESTIKTGLTSAAQSIADFELMNHDLRKYKEILSYFAKNDEHSLKAMFIDQVDVHTDLPAQPIALRSIVGRWPTIIADFMRLKEKDTEPDKIAKEYDLSKAEAIILTTKNKLFLQWKKLFGEAAKERYELLKGLVKGRKKSIEEYRDWLKPYIARFKMTKLGSEKPSGRAKTLRTFVDVAGMSTFANEIRLFAWKPLKTEEPRRPAAEIKEGFVINPYDDYVRENFILDPYKGLAALYPWLNNDKKFCPKCKKYFPPDVMECSKCGSINLVNKKLADQIIEEDILVSWKKKEMRLDPSELYYIFLDFNIFRTGTRTQVGEIEDIVFNCKNFVVSQNVLLVKILELKCRELELERYIDEILGLRFDEREVSDLVKEEFPQLFPKPKKLSGWKNYLLGLKDTSKSYTDFLRKMKIPKSNKLMFVKPGPYERDMKDRISKQYLKMSSNHFAIITGYLKEMMGVE